MGTGNRKQGFTLIEAAVAIAVVAILSGIIVPLVIKNLRDSQRARALNDVQVIAAAVASQMKDTGRRPMYAAGPGGSTGAGQAIWASGGTAIPGINPAAANTFTNLFCATPIATGGDAPQVLFYNAGTTVSPSTEFAYKGPYLANDVAAKSDPWGNKYVILGYNATSSGYNGPVWVLSSGPDGRVLAANYTATATGYPATWTTTTTSADDIAVRVN
jgi:prepilin-type N-terminal cleavage/methylation domain-containing protein